MTTDDKTDGSLPPTIESDSPLRPQFSFTTQTCLELVDLLNDAQITRELRRLIPFDEHKLLNNTRDKRFALRTLYTHGISTDSEHVVNSNSNSIEYDRAIDSVIGKLTSSISRRNEKLETELDRLTSRIEEAHNLLPQPTKETLIPPPTTPQPPLQLTQEVSSPGTTVKPFAIAGILPFEDLDLNHLNADTDYDISFSSRTVGFYGDLPYKYAGGFHKARPFSDNPYLVKISEHLTKMLPGVQFNSATVTKYENGGSHIPPHQDNESQIVPGSDIVTVSLGASREVVFRPLPPAPYSRIPLPVSHGQVYVMSRQSQDLYDHAVPPVTAVLPPGLDTTRISVTFRMLRSLEEAKKASRRRPGTSSPSPSRASTRAKPIKVLVLSDSKNRSFDCSLLKDPVVAFRKDLFYIRDIKDHIPAIEQSDVVLISSGVNDLRFAGARPGDLHALLRDFTGRFPRVKFLFDSISPVALRADPNQGLNRAIGATNWMVINLSMRVKNFRLFDCTSFGMSHLARDGIHLTNQGQDILSEGWVRAVLISLRFIKTDLPLRKDFRDLVSRRLGGPKPG